MERARGIGSTRIARRWGLWAAGYVAVLALVAWPAWTGTGPSVAMIAPTPEAPSANADPLFSLWWIDWVWAHPEDVLRGEAHCEELFFPFGVGLRLLASFQNIVLLALEPLGSAVSAYNTMWALSFLFAALATAALAFEVSGSSPGAFVAGLLVAFGPGFYEHSLHHAYKMLAFGWLPLLLLFLHRFLRRGGPASLLATLACAVLILASDWENALFAALASSVFVLAGLVDPGTSRRWQRATALLVLLPLLAGFLWWALGSVPAEEPEMLLGSRGERARYSVDLLNTLLPHPHHAILGRWSAGHLATLPGSSVEKTAFFGWIFPLALAWGAWARRRDRRLWPWAVVAALFLVLALGPHLQWSGDPLFRLPGWWLQQVPGFTGNRAPGRFALVTYLALGVALSLVVARTRRPDRAAAAMAVLMAVEFAPFATPFAAPRTSPALAALGRTPGEGSVLDVPYRVGVPRYLLDQTEHRRALVTGHMVRMTSRFARHPADIPGFDVFRDPVGAPLPVAPEALSTSLRDLLGVRYVVIHKLFASDWPRARRRLLASGLPLEAVAEDEEVVVLRLDAAAGPSGTLTEPLRVGTGGFHDRVLLLGWGAGGAEDPLVWGQGRWQRLALAPPPGIRAVGLDVVSYRATITRRPQRLEVASADRTQTFVVGPHWREVEVPVLGPPGRPWVLTFRVDEPSRPVDREPDTSSDRRSLSIGLRGLRWIP